MGSAGLRWEVKGMIVLLFVLLPGIFAGVQHRLLSLFQFLLAATGCGRT